MKRLFLALVLASCSGNSLALSPASSTPTLHPERVNATITSVLTYLRHVGAPR